MTNVGQLMQSKPGFLDPGAIKNRATLETLFKYYGSEPDPSGKQWRCLFPERHTHGDSTPSVTFFKERATCHSQRCFQQADVFQLVGLMEIMPTFIEQKTWICEQFGLNGQSPTAKVVARYDYMDESGALLFQVVRFEPKTFKQRRPDGNDGWIWGLGNTRRLLFRLPDVIKSQTILVLEGEKDVETAGKLGLPTGWAATTNPMGAGKWRPEYSESLRGKKVVIAPDQDEAGRRHGEQIAQALTGVATEVRYLTLPFGKDLSEWAEAGGTTEEFQSLLANVPDFCSSVAYRNTDPTEKHLGKPPDARGVIIRLRSFDEITPEPVEFAWSGHIVVRAVKSC